MEVIPGYVDMALTPSEKKEDAPSLEPMAAPIYPYGLCICFTHEELEKLNLDDDVQVGNHIRLDCIAKVTSVSTRDTTDGAKTRVEMQIIAIEAEGETVEEEAVEKKPRYGKMYNAG